MNSNSISSQPERNATRLRKIKKFHTFVHSFPLSYPIRYQQYCWSKKYEMLRNVCMCIRGATRSSVYSRETIVLPHLHCKSCTCEVSYERRQRESISLVCMSHRSVFKSRALWSKWLLPFYSFVDSIFFKKVRYTRIHTSHSTMSSLRQRSHSAVLT